MSETNNNVLTLNQNPKNINENNDITANSNENKENQTQETILKNPVPYTSLQVNSTIENVQLNLNKKNIIELPSEIKTKLNISPCSQCQSENYSLFIPERFSEENKNNNQEEPANVNSEIRVISEKYNIYFPILICQSNHQRCLICNLEPHNDKVCNEQFLNYGHILSLYDIIKEIVPEQKKDDFDCLYNFALNNSNNQNQSSEPGCCNCKCVWTNSLLILLLLLWTCCSVALFALGVGFCALSLGLRVLCCLYHFCYQACCTTTVTEEVRGNYIVRTTTHHVDRERADEAEQEQHDEALAICGAKSMYCLICFIPEGYKKIMGWYDDWKRP